MRDSEAPDSSNISSSNVNNRSSFVPNRTDMVLISGDDDQEVKPKITTKMPSAAFNIQGSSPAVILREEKSLDQGSIDRSLEEHSLLISDAHSKGTEPLAETSFLERSNMLERMLAGKGLNIHIVERNGMNTSNGGTVSR